jgi:DNA-binding IclR family transcriptional regulator
MKRVMSTNSKTATEPTAAGDTEGAKRETGTIARTIMVLRAIADTNVEPTLKDLADTVNLPLSTMHRLLELLAKEGIVARDDMTKTFRPGMEFFRLASHVVNRMPLTAAARPFLSAATEDCDESSYLAILDARANKLIFTACAESRQMLDYRVPLNERVSLAKGASGLAVLAWMRPERIAAVLATEAPNDPPTLEELAPTLERIRQIGYANTFSGRIKGAIGFFAPVFDGSGEVCASFGFTIPQVRFEPSVSDRLIETILRRGGELSRALGYSAAYPRPAETYTRNGKSRAA